MEARRSFIYFFFGGSGSPDLATPGSGDLSKSPSALGSDSGGEVILDKIKIQIHRQRSFSSDHLILTGSRQKARISGEK